jgi:hypothetical protein
VGRTELVSGTKRQRAVCLTGLKVERGDFSGPDSAVVAWERDRRYTQSSVYSVAGIAGSFSPRRVFHPAYPARYFLHRQGDGYRVASREAAPCVKMENAETGSDPRAVIGSCVRSRGEVIAGTVVIVRERSSSHVLCRATGRQAVPGEPGGHHEPLFAIAHQVGVTPLPPCSVTRTGSEQEGPAPPYKLRGEHNVRGFRTGVPAPASAAGATAFRIQSCSQRGVVSSRLSGQVHGSSNTEGFLGPALRLTVRDRPHCTRRSSGPPRS